MCNKQEANIVVAGSICSLDIELLDRQILKKGEIEKDGNQFKLRIGQVIIDPTRQPRVHMRFLAELQSFNNKMQVLR